MIERIFTVYRHQDNNKDDEIWSHSKLLWKKTIQLAPVYKCSNRSTSNAESQTERESERQNVSTEFVSLDGGDIVFLYIVRSKMS